jgi:hypothetical protein
LCSDVFNLTEDQLKQRRAVCESEDEEENDVDVKRLYLSTCLLKKGLQIAVDFVDHLFEICYFVESARNLSESWRLSWRHVRSYVYNNIQEKTKESKVISFSTKCSLCPSATHYVF